MIELLILAVINLFVIIGSLVFRYFYYVNNRKVFDERVQLLHKSKKAPSINPFVYFPDAWHKTLQKLNFLDQKNNEVKGTGLLQQITPANLIMMNVAVIVIAFNMQKLAKVPWYISVMVLFALQGFAYLYLQGKQVLVKEAIEKKLPDILDMLARVYRVHTDLRVAVREVAQHSNDEIVRTEFKRIAQLSQFGYSVEDALEHLAKDIKSPDLDFVVSSIKLNVPVGGNLPYLFEHTAQMLRQRKEATDEINNLMFQSKISSTISALLVPVIAIFSFVSSEKYQDALLRNPTGRMVFFFCLIWWFIGVVIIRKNSRISL